ncbi:MAG: 30S ribosomal protein S13 [Candidatus Lloydbacteria bacterium RIFOXYC12_FULL_46_25]|uniref:Small ribosomal subunit protein uS13 n=1 Tax=Candidatus Lloydbacteria bacterium RIFOXYC12_FULL_46_25 TaxID=1798670 RepID=A0A1G2E023_9BACT|nr:MAG: 30S ribosomal protein S13 [Candidatus Lloydbacteria bacterium RIFOXYC12_FULL_46_25]
MMRILGITVPDNKQLWVGLTVFYGIGFSKARKILSEAGVKAELKPTDVSTEDEAKIRKIIETMKIEGDLRREKMANIKRLKDIKSYRGSRHSRGLPSRGQRTKTNSRTVRGNVRKTMGSGRRKLEKK